MEGLPDRVKHEEPLNNLSPKSCARELKRADITGDEMLMEFVKYDKAEIPKKEYEEEMNKHGKMKDVVTPFGTDISSLKIRQRDKMGIKRHTISCTRPSVHQHHDDPDESFDEDSDF